MFLTSNIMILAKRKETSSSSLYISWYVIILIGSTHYLDILFHIFRLIFALSSLLSAVLKDIRLHFLCFSQVLFNPGKNLSNFDWKADTDKLLGITWHYLALPGITWHYLALNGLTWQYLALPGITWQYMALPGTTWHYLALPGITWH